MLELNSSFGWGGPLARFFTGLCFLGLLSLSACMPSGTLNLSEGHWVDLTHAFSEETIYWPNAEPFHLVKVHEGQTPGGFHYAANQFEAAEHGGTHMDAPIHFDAGGESVDQMGLEKLMGPFVVVDVSVRFEKDLNGSVGPSDFLEFEKAHGPIPTGAIVLLRTGFERYWPDRERYLGTSERGENAISKLKFPGLSRSGAEWLIKNRNIRAVGLDTASIDPGSSKTFDSHRVLAAHHIPIFENLTQLSKLPATGGFLMALPMKIKGGSGAPLRAVAWVPS